MKVCLEPMKRVNGRSIKMLWRMCIVSPEYVAESICHQIWQNEYLIVHNIYVIYGNACTVFEDFGEYLVPFGDIGVPMSPKSTEVP